MAPNGTANALRERRAHSARASRNRAHAWRCGWCSRDRAGVERAPGRIETTGICDPCLRSRRAIGFVQRGRGFLVWDEDAREAERWAAELREVTRRPSRCSVTRVAP